MEEDIEITDINVGELEIDIKAIKSLLKELETERDDIQLICIRAELELSIKNILNRLEQDERVIEEMAKSWKQDDIRSVEEIIDHFRKKCE